MSATLTREQSFWRWRVLISTYLGYAGYYLVRRVFTIAKTSLSADFGWDLQQIAHIWTVYLVAYMVGQFVNSFLGRRVGPRTILLWGLAVSIGCNVVFGCANSYATFIVFMGVNGLVQATGWPGVVGSVSRWIRGEERGTVMGVWSTSYQLGSILVKALGAYLLGAYGWRYAFFGCTLVTVGVWLLLYFWQRNQPEDVGVASILDGEPDVNKAVAASEAASVSFGEYLQLVFSPVVLIMGASYFCIKFLRYALDSWLPTFLNIQGMDVARAGFYSQIFDWAGLGGVILTGYLLDKVFRGNWAALSFVMAIGMILSYVAVIYLGTTPWAIALCFGLVGVMVYGPDTLLCGAASVEVAGAANGVAVAGIVNGVGSIGPVIQEEVIGWMMKGDVLTGIRNTNRLYLSMSVLFALLMVVVMFRLSKARRHAQSVERGASEEVV